MANSDGNAAQRVTRLIHMHIPKTAGTALQLAFLRAFNGRRRVYPQRFEPEFININVAEYDFYSGHIGFRVADQIGGDVVTVLRDPVDRFISTYFFLRSRYESGDAVTRKTALAARYPLREIAKMTDEPILVTELANRMTWQVGHSHLPAERQRYLAAGHSEAELLRRAVDNLGRCAVVGLVTRMDDLVRRVDDRLAIKLQIDTVNTTVGRPAKADVEPSILRDLERWLYLDLELYAAACRMVSAD